MTPEDLAARGLRVKPLGEWRRWETSPVVGIGCWTAQRYAIVTADDLDANDVEYEIHHAQAVISRHPTLEAAQAAAEADHAARIAAQIEDAERKTPPE
jgi:hypothetical protein